MPKKPVDEIDPVIEDKDLEEEEIEEETLPPSPPHRTVRRSAPRSSHKRRIIVQQRLSRLHHKLGSSPLIMFFLGGLVLLLWLAGTVVQVQTSEYLALGGQQRVAGVAWSILLQPWLMISGQAPASVVTAWLYGWVVEVITLVFAMALSVAVMKISTVNPRFGRWFVVFGLLLIGLNSWADYSSSPGTNPLTQALIALAIGMIVTIGLPLGIGLIEHGVEEL